MAKYYTGAKKDIRDDRDYEIDHLLKGAEEFDWVKGYDIEEEIGIKIPVRHQGKTSACVSFATAYYVWVKNVIELIKKYGKTKIITDYLNNNIISPKAFYSQVWLNGGGSHLRDNLMLTVNWGAVPENKVKFKDDEEDARDLTWKNEDIDEVASSLQSQEVRMLRAKDDIDSMAIAIRDNHGCVLGVSGENNNTWKTTFPKPGKAVWGHGIFGGKAKLIKGKKYIGILNSWGEETGELGWQWLGEEWFTSGLIFNPWVMFDKDNTGWLWLIDRNGKERKWLWEWNKTLYYLLNKRNFKLK